MDVRRLRPQEWIAGACGAALVVALFLDWYGAGSARQSAWESYGALDVVLAVAGLMGVAVAIVTAAHRTQAVPLALAALLVLVGVIASVWLVVRVASPPDVAASVPHGPRATGYRPGVDREAGLWIGLAACLGVTAAAMLSIRDERFPGAVVEAARVDAPTLPAPPPEGAGKAGS